MEDIIKIVTSLKDSGLLLKGVSETIQNEAKEQKGGFLSMLLGTLGARLLGNILAGKGVIRAGDGAIAQTKSVSKETRSKRQGKGIVRAGRGRRSSKKNGFLMLPHPLTNFEIQKYYQNEPRFNGVSSRDNLPEIKDGVYVINLHEYSDIRTHWIALYALNNVTYFDSFGVGHIPKEIKTFINKSTIVTNISRIQAYDSIMCGYFCIGFIGFILLGKTLTNFINLFSLNNFKENYDIILN